MKQCVVVVFMFLAQSARSAPCALPQDALGPGLSNWSNSRRLAYLAEHLSQEGAQGRRWTLGWGATFGVLTLGQLAVVPVFSDDEKPDMYWGALSAAIGVAFTILPLEVLNEGSAFAQRAQAVTDDGTCTLIAEGERVFQAIVEQETVSQRWYAHLGNVLVNVAFGLILGLGYGHWTTGFLNMGIGVAVGEATIFTSPTSLIPKWKQYREGKESGISVEAGPGNGVVIRF